MRYGVPDTIAYIDGAEMEQGEVLFLTRLPHGRTVRLESLGRRIWITAAEGGDAVAMIAELVGQPRERFEADVTSFLEDLVHRGLLAES